MFKIFFCLEFFFVTSLIYSTQLVSNNVSYKEIQKVIN